MDGERERERERERHEFSANDLLVPPCVESPRHEYRNMNSRVSVMRMGFLIYHHNVISLTSFCNENNHPKRQVGYIFCQIRRLSPTVTLLCV